MPASTAQKRDAAPLAKKEDALAKKSSCSRGGGNAGSSRSSEYWVTVEVDSDEEEEADVGDAKKQDFRYRSQDELDARSCAAEKKGEDFDELLDFISVLDNKVREFELLIRRGMRKEQDIVSWVDDALQVYRSQSGRRVRKVAATVRVREAERDQDDIVFTPS